MPTYAYTAVDARGQQKSGTIDAADTNDATAQIKKMGFFPTRIAEAGTEAAASVTGAPVKGKKSSGSISGKVLTVFTRQLATLIDAGLPLLRALNTLIKQEKSPVLRNAMTNMATAVESGGTFSEALAQHPRIFTKLYVNMVKAGELGGVLEIVLTRLAEFQEKSEKIKGKVISAMVYPIVVLLIAVAIMAFLLVFIVPKFKQIFADMLGGKPLPGLTQFVIAVSEAFQQNFILIGVGLVVVVIAYKVFAKTPFGALFIDRFKLQAPLLGDLVRKSAISRFSRTLGTLVSSGVPILQALNITKETAGNIVIANSIAKVHDSVKEGETIVTPLEASGVFPPMVISMIQVGEETGQLPDMLIKIADVYDEEVDNAVAGLTSLLEPVMIVFLAVIVGTIVIALFLPLIGIINQLGAQSQ
ncbi:MAG: pilus assembly protein PilC [Verrucomicrobia bacterium Tous-C9LFEB]|nr:MAG: pilus assembly protein PilC [Verrucomicrobia bacterium Tous-C9LFEB]